MYYNGENIMLIDPAWKRYESLKHAEPASASLAECNDCGKPITKGTYCPACAFLELEGYVYKLNAYLKNLHKRGMEIPDTTAQDGTMIGGIEVALKLFVRPMVSICKEVGSNV